MLQRINARRPSKTKADGLGRYFNNLRTVECNPFESFILSWAKSPRSAKKPRVHNKILTYLNHFAWVCVVSLYFTPLKKFTLFGVSELLKILKVSLIFIVLLSISSYRTWIISNIVLLNIFPSGFKSEMAWIRPMDLFRTWIWSTWFAENNRFYEYRPKKSKIWKSILD